VQHYGADNGLLLEESTILSELDTEGISNLQELSTEARQSWAEAVALRLVRHRGIVPTGWTKTAHCYLCGSGYSYHDLNMLSCEWCDMRSAGKRFPVPDE